MKKNRAVIGACAFAFGVNFLLFIVKLYIGLRSNSISIFSDAVNNMFDSLSGVVTLVCIALVMKNSDNAMTGTVKKSEQLFSFLMALIVSFAGFYFAYSSLERFMYPTPVWFTVMYAVVLSGTAAIKIIMYFVYGVFSKRSGSPIIKVMKTDCILDFFITLMTVVTLIVSQYGTYAFDAFFGLIISIIIVVSAFKMVISNAKSLINVVPTVKREAFEEYITGLSEDIIIKEYTTDGENFFAYLQCENISDEIKENIKYKAKDVSDIEACFIM